MSERPLAQHPTVTPRASWRDALDTQLEMVRWVESTGGQRWMKLKCLLENQEYEQRTQALITGLYSIVPDQLRSGVPFFVSRDMCRLVEAASETFQPEPIFPTDVLNLCGFLYYERPFQVPDRFDHPVTIKAISWQPMMGDQDIQPDRVLTRDDEFVEWLEERHSKGLVDGLALTIYAQPDPEEWSGRAADVMVPPLEPLHVTPWWWGMTFDGNEWTEGGVPTGAAWWWKIVQTTWRLMQQHITVRHPERPWRPQRREAKRMGVPEHDVVVVRLRREKGDGHHDEPMSERHFSHRFIRHEHWRNQWYPSVQKHRQIWIADTIVGPEDAPLIIKPRAYNWTR